MLFDNASVLITGGTGSFGKRFVATLLERAQPRRLIVFSRDELKQSEMERQFPLAKYPCMRYFLGDVRDPDRLHDAFNGVDYVVHAAALKQVPAAEYNPFEAIKTNVMGAMNVVRAAIDRKVKKIVALSTDKAANPVNLYGATKLCSDKVFVAGNHMAGAAPTRFAAVRYGNVLGSRGSVIPLFLAQRAGGEVTITDERMTRFSITLQQGVDFVLRCFENMSGGEVFVPKLPSYRLLDVAAAVAPEAKIKVVGIRPGEKLHECMVPEDEAWHTLEFSDHFIIQPAQLWWTQEDRLKRAGGQLCPAGFTYTSDRNPCWLTPDDLRRLIDTYLANRDRGLA